MKTLDPATSINRFPFVVLSFALLAKTIIIIWFVWHIYGLDDVSTTVGHNHSSWLLAAIVTVILLTLLTWLKIIRNLYSSQKTIVVNNAERTRVEKDLQQSEAHFRDLIENANDLIYTGDLQGNFTSLNKVGEVITGYTQAEFCKMKFADVVAPEHLENARQKFAQKIISHIPTAYELEIITKSGQHIALALSNRVIFKAGEAIGVQGIGRDITDHKLAEKTLRESEARYRVVTESASDAILTIDRESTILFVNSAAEKIFGYTVDEMLGNKLSMLMPEAMRDAHAAGMKRFQETNKRQISWRDLELTGLHKDGREVSLEITFGEINSDGKHLFTAVIRDITERKQARKELQSNLSLLTSTFEATADGILVVNRDNKIVTYNQRFIEMWQIPDEIIDSRDNAKTVYHILEQLSNADDFVTTTKHLTRHPEINNLDIVEFKDGKIFERYSHPQMLDGEVIGRVVSFRDITARKRAENALLESERYLRTLLENINEGLVQVNVNDVIEFVNDRFCEMVGFEREELLGKITFDMLLDEEGRKLLEAVNRQRQEGISGQYEMRLKKESGEMLWVLIGGSPIVNADGEMTGTLGVFTDITERKRAEEQLLHDAFHDGLTGLANRALFMDHLRMTIERGKSCHSNPYAVLFLDFDRFKVVNDSLGHAEGDQLLHQIARRLESSTRTGDLVARLGGDEFVILLSEMLAEGDAVQVAERIQKDLKKPFTLSSSEIFISASIGVALSNAGHKRAEDMVRDADIAMYRAKAGGKAQYRVFDRAMHEYATSQLQLETEMRQAIEYGEFQLHYQPIISLDTETLVGFEALVRWQHPTRGMIPPLEFIGAAEENGLILPLGNWILQESCRQLRRWQDDNPAASHLMMSVNLSCKQFLQIDLAEQIAVALGKSGLDPRCLKLEITESYIMEKSETAVTIMNRLHSLGVEISLDDFGTGYSSLSYLHRLPVDYLKVDRSFVSRMTDSQENREIVRTIIKLAQNLKMKTIAEGIETADQLAHLKNLHCEYGQGYFFSKPLEAKSAEKFIEENLEDFPFVIRQDFGNELNM